jgi:hypothetical protein
VHPPAEQAFKCLHVTLSSIGMARGGARACNHVIPLLTCLLACLQVLPLMQELIPNFSSDLLVFNAGWAGTALTATLSCITAAAAAAPAASVAAAASLDHCTAVLLYAAALIAGCTIDL